jgi:hypothetical protein
MYTIILNMYKDVKSCITYNYCKSDYFNCDIREISSEKRHNLSFNIAVNNLPRQLRIVIGRKFFGSSGLPLHKWQNVYYYSKYVHRC